jgi:tetratricopeptide (TPR) repeat protein
MRPLAYVIVGAILVCVAPVEAARAVSMRVDSLLAAASDTTGEYRNRVRLIREAIRFDDTGWAMYELARLYGDERTPGTRRQASTWLRRAMRKDKTNMDFRIEYARVLWALGRRGHAYKNAKRGIDLNPNHVGALYLAGRYAAWQMSRYLEGERVDYQYDDLGNRRTRSFSLEKFGEEDRDQAIGYLTRALNVDPDHRPSLLLLGLVYYEAQMPEKMALLFEDFLKRHPDDPNAYFFLGLAYQAQDELKRAYPAYVNGLRRMQPRQQQFMMSVFMLVGKKSMEADEELPDEEALRAFWTGRDPLFLTPTQQK